MGRRPRARTTASECGQYLRADLERKMQQLRSLLSEDGAEALADALGRKLAAAVHRIVAKSGANDTRQGEVVDCRAWAAVPPLGIRVFAGSPPRQRWACSLRVGAATW